MNQKKYNADMGNLRQKIKTFKEQGKDVLFTAIFVTGREKAKLIDRAPTEQLSLITKNLKCEESDKVKVELYDGKEAPNPLWIKELVIKQPEPEVAPLPSGFRGLGEAEINDIVDGRFKERQRNAEYEDLKEQVMELSGENEELQDKIDQLEEKNATLEQELESKKQVRYYTGMLSDILESFGIAKDRIKKPIAELMGITDSEKPAQLDQAKTDQSGIVEDKQDNPTPEGQKRNEVITLISEYLASTSNQTLANVFGIFSEIEQDPVMADKIIQYVNTLKTTNHANV